MFIIVVIVVIVIVVITIFFYIKVATAAANGDKNIGELVAKAIEKVGKDGYFFIYVSCLFNLSHSSFLTHLCLRLIWHSVTLVCYLSLFPLLF